MKKILGIVVLSLLLSGNVYAGWFGKWSGYVYPDASEVFEMIIASISLFKITSEIF